MILFFINIKKNKKGKKNKASQKKTKKSTDMKFKKDFKTK